MNAEEYVSRNYVLKCMEDSWKHAGIPADAKSKFTKWLMKAPVVLASQPTSKPMTNADRIRAMTDEELAQFIHNLIIDRNIGIPTGIWLDWLKVEGEA